MVLIPHKGKGITIEVSTSELTRCDSTSDKNKGKSKVHLVTMVITRGIPCRRRREWQINETLSQSNVPFELGLTSRVNAIN